MRTIRYNHYFIVIGAVLIWVTKSLSASKKDWRLFDSVQEAKDYIDNLKRQHETTKTVD